VTEDVTKFEGNVIKISTEIGYDYNTVRKYLKKRGKFVPNYRGFKDPLDYYEAHPELHELGRWELAKQDNALYCALLRRGLISKLIPEINCKGNSGRKPISKKEEERILRIYIKSGFNYAETARRTGYSVPTIKKKIKKLRNSDTTILINPEWLDL